MREVYINGAQVLTSRVPISFTHQDFSLLCLYTLTRLYTPQVWGQIAQSISLTALSHKSQWLELFFLSFWTHDQLTFYDTVSYRQPGSVDELYHHRLRCISVPCYHVH